MMQGKDHRAANHFMNSKTDWEKLTSMDDENIDMSDIDELDDDFFQQAEIHIPPNKN